MGDIELQPFVLHQPAGRHSFLAALVGEFHIHPAGETVVQIPLALAMAQQYEFAGHYGSPIGADQRAIVAAARASQACTRSPHAARDALAMQTNDPVFAGWDGSVIQARQLQRQLARRVVLMTR